MADCDKKSDLHGWIDAHSHLYDYMGHFMNAKILSQGHNTDKPSTGDTSGADDAAEVDKLVEGLGSGRLTQEASTSPEGA
jgi:hypothetical protein